MAVLAQIAAQQTAFDYALFTGDLSQDQSVASYQHIAKAVSRWPQPCFWLPGNHDDIQNMERVFANSQLQRVTHVALGEHWQMLMLNSQVFDKPHGYINAAQFDHVEALLANNPDRHSLIVLHHNVLLSGSKWLDQHCLQNHQEFWQRLGKYPQVKAVLGGHIHQDFDLSYQGVRVLATPSTCIQFLPHSTDFALDSNAPGWREVQLNADGSIATKVQRISHNRFFADMSASGY